MLYLSYEPGGWPVESSAALQTEIGENREGGGAEEESCNNEFGT